MSKVRTNLVAEAVLAVISLAVLWSAATNGQEIGGPARDRASISRANRRLPSSDPYQCHVDRPYLGVQARFIHLGNGPVFVSPATPRNSAAVNNEQQVRFAPPDQPFHSHGYLIERVVWGTPAHRAGLEKGDIVVEANGRQVSRAMSLGVAIQNSDPWLQLKLINVRNSQLMDVWVHMGVGHDLQTAMMSGESLE